MDKFQNRNQKINKRDVIIRMNPLQCLEGNSSKLIKFSNKTNKKKILRIRDKMLEGTIYDISQNYRQFFISPWNTIEEEIKLQNLNKKTLKIDVFDEGLQQEWWNYHTMQLEIYAKSQVILPHILLCKSGYFFNNHQDQKVREEISNLYSSILSQQFSFSSRDRLTKQSNDWILIKNKNQEISISNQTSTIRKFAILSCSAENNKFRIIKEFKIRPGEKRLIKINQEMSFYNQQTSAVVILNEKDQNLYWFPFQKSDYKDFLWLKNDSAYLNGKKIAVSNNSMKFIQDYCRKVPEGQLRPCFLEVKNLSKQRLKMYAFMCGNQSYQFQYQTQVFPEQIESIRIHAFGRARIRDSENNYLYCIEFESVSDGRESISIFEDLCTLNDEAIEPTMHEHNTD